MKEKYMREGCVRKSINEICDKASSNIAQNKIAGICGEYPVYGASGYVQNVDFYHRDAEYIGIVKDGSGVGRVNIYPAYSSLLGTMQYILPKEGNLLGYVAYALKGLNLSSFASGAAIPHIYFKDYGKCKIDVPPMEEQERIVAELDLLQSVIDKKKAQLDEYDKLAQSIFYEMFGDPIDNPKKWEVKKLGDECSEIRYGTSKPACENGKYKYLRMGNITNDGFLDLSNIKTIDIPDDEVEKCVVRYGDILFNRTNSLDLIGKTCMFDLEEPMIIAGYIIRVRLSKKLMPRYVSTMFNIPSMKLHLKKMAKGAVNQANINSKELASIIIPLPPLSLQQSFAEKIEAIEHQKELVKQSLNEVKTLFDSRMDYYFN